jgi:hypothetical protein
MRVSGDRPSNLDGLIVVHKATFTNVPTMASIMIAQQSGNLSPIGFRDKPEKEK